MTVTLLEREMYSEAAAARLLRLAPATLHYWLEGGNQRGQDHPPVIRESRRGGHPPVTWAEFVEAGLLRQYRRQHNIPMATLRKFIDGLREEYGVAYPLAHSQPFISGRELVMNIQTKVGLDADFAVVVQANNQYVLSGPALEFFERITWDGDGVAALWRPDRNDESPVIVDPDVRFGAPSVRGISTEILWEQSQSGEDVADLAETYSLTASEVSWALAFQLTLAAA